MLSLADGECFFVNRGQFHSTNWLSLCVFKSPPQLVHRVDFLLLPEVNVQNFELKEVLFKTIQLLQGIAGGEINKISINHTF